jgi:hypothetical protein
VEQAGPIADRRGRRKKTGGLTGEACLSLPIQTRKGICPSGPLVLRQSDGPRSSTTLNGQVTETLAWGRVTDGGSPRRLHRRRGWLVKVGGVGGEVGDASGGVSSAGAPAPAGSTGSSSDGGAPWSGSTAEFPAKSAQGKELRGLAKVRGQVFRGKGGQGNFGEGGHLLGASQRVSALSLALCSERERRATLSRLRVGCGGEWSGVRGRVARGGGFYSDGGFG